MCIIFTCRFSLIKRFNGHGIIGYRKKYERDSEANRLWRKFNTSWSGEFEKMDCFDESDN